MLYRVCVYLLVNLKENCTMSLKRNCTMSFRYCINQHTLQKKMIDLSEDLNHSDQFI